MDKNDHLIGKQVGNYHILAEINRGSFGSVYQGKHIIFNDDPIVAIKLLHAALQSQQEHADFIKEAQVLKKLSHPNILRIFDAGFQDGIPYLVTEYAAGGSLRDRLSKSNGKPLTLNEATSILTQIGQALHYAHQRNIVHRDLKPENILFNQTGEALLADFGIAVLLASTRTGLVGASGTPPYMAPEQFEGLVSTKSDQYSLGCIAYELVTGQRLFTIPNRSLEAYWFHHAKVEPTPPTHYHPHIPAYIERAILKALMKERNHRFIDVPAFNRALLTNSKELNVDTSKEQTKAAQIVAISLKLQRQSSSKNPDLDEFDQIIGKAPLPDGSILPKGYCVWEGKSKSYMYLGKLVDGVWLRYGNQKARWYCKRDDWKALQSWIAEVRSEWFRNTYGTNDPPTEEERIYAPTPK